MRRRGEYVERTFAHVYDTGGMRRTHLRGHTNIQRQTQALFPHGPREPEAVDRPGAAELHGCAGVSTRSRRSSPLRRWEREGLHIAAALASVRRHRHWLPPARFIRPKKVWGVGSPSTHLTCRPLSQLSFRSSLKPGSMLPLYFGRAG
jgi:hypothetical protein